MKVDQGSSKSSDENDTVDCSKIKKEKNFKSRKKIGTERKEV